MIINTIIIIQIYYYLAINLQFIYYEALIE